MTKQRKTNNENIIKVYNIFTNQMNKSYSMEKECKKYYIISWLTLITQYIIYELLLSLTITFITNEFSINIYFFLSFFGYSSIISIWLIVYIWKFIDKHNEFSNFIIKNKTINTTDFNKMVKKHNTSYLWPIITSFETTINLIINIKAYKYKINEILSVRQDIGMISKVVQLKFIKKFLTVQKIKNPKNEQEDEINYWLTDLDKCIVDLGEDIKEIYSDFSVIFNKALKEIDKFKEPLEMFYYKVDGKYKFDEIIAFQFISTLKFIKSINIFSIIDTNKLNTLNECINKASIAEAENINQNMNNNS